MTATQPEPLTPTGLDQLLTEAANWLAAAAVRSPVRVVRPDVADRVGRLVYWSPHLAKVRLDSGAWITVHHTRPGVTLHLVEVTS